jgi:hypothetical protein
MSLDGNTMLAYDEGAANHRFSLARGSVHLEVAKLKRGQRFLLNTVDAEVEVHGTVFDVSVLNASNGCEQRTRVSVKEGLVEVRSAVELRTLRSGEVWTGTCPSPAKASKAELTSVAVGSAKSAIKSESLTEHLASRSISAVDPTDDARPPSGTGQATTPNLLLTEATPASELAKQNDIYARASVEQNQGHRLEALALYNQLIARYPGSALVESAHVQRIRLLRQTNKADAIREAGQYLVQFPKGFARAEAEALVNTP